MSTSGKKWLEKKVSVEKGEIKLHSPQRARWRSQEKPSTLRQTADGEADQSQEEEKSFIINLAIMQMPFW